MNQFFFVFVCLFPGFDRRFLSPEPWLTLFWLLGFSALAGLVVFLVCRFYYRDVLSDHPLTGSLLPAALLTTLLYYQNTMLPGLAILVIAILAYIHYRAVIKDMSDVNFVFWAIMTGLLIGTGLTWQVLLGNLLLALAIGLWLFIRSGRQTFLLLVRYQKDLASDPLQALLAPLKGQVRSQNEQDGWIDLAVEVKLRRISLAQIDTITGIAGVESALIISQRH